MEAGAFRKIYRPGPPEVGMTWHVNDHALIQGPDKLWHMFGIAWPDPGVKPEPSQAFLEHATSPRLDADSWTRQEPVLKSRPDREETVVWAPHVVRHGDTYFLFYSTGGHDLTRWGISLATSQDLTTWEPQGDGPMFRDGFQARDPMILHLPESNLWVMYYTATENPTGGRHVVAYRTSPDLRSWSDRKIAFRDEHEGTDFGPTESPFVVARNGWYYLFLGPRPYDRPTTDRPNHLHPGYVGTDVFASRDWKTWDKAPIVGHLASHAAEVVRDDDGRWFVSHCGIGQHGVFLAPLRWHD